jgi:hypothetical protein
VLVRHQVRDYVRASNGEMSVEERAAKLEKIKVVHQGKKIKVRELR